MIWDVNTPLAFLFSFFAAVCAITLSTEGYERLRIYRDITSQISYGTSTWDGPQTFIKAERVGGLFPPNADLTRRDYGPDGSLLRSHTFHVNNLGWISRNNYDEAKSPGEFRIAVVGDSFVAGDTSATQWVDATQRVLSADSELLSFLGARSITALNLGLPGADPGVMQSVSTSVARDFQSDLTIVGFIYESLRRPAPVHGAVSSELILGDVHTSIYCENTDTLSEHCRDSLLWNVRAGRSLSKSEVIEIRQAIHKAILRRGLLRPRLYFLNYLTSETADVPVVGQQESEQDILALTSFATIAKQSPETAFVLIPPPWYFDPATEPVGMSHFLTMANKSGIHIIDSRTLLPKVSAQERLSWYIEGDRHFSDKGNVIYGRAIADLVHQQLLKRDQKLLDSHSTR